MHYIGICGVYHSFRTAFGDNSTRTLASITGFPIILVIAGKNVSKDNTETQSLYVHKAHTNKYYHSTQIYISTAYITRSPIYLHTRK